MGDDTQAPASNPPTPDTVPAEPAPEVAGATEITAPAPADQPATENTTPPAAPPQAPTAQMPASEPLPPESEPLNAPQDKSITLPPPAPQSPVPVPPSPATQNARDLLVKANAVKQSRKRKKLERILEILATQGKITNDEVEKLLHVSDATATRYLSELQKQGKTKQVGRVGHAVEYVRV